MKNSATKNTNVANAALNEKTDQFANFVSSKFIKKLPLAAVNPIPAKIPMTVEMTPKASVSCINKSPICDFFAPNIDIKPYSD